MTMEVNISHIENHSSKKGESLDDIGSKWTTKGTCLMR